MAYELLKLYKKHNGLTVEELSHKSGVPVGTLTRLLSNSDTNPTLNTLVALKELLNCNIDNLVEDSNSNYYKLYNYFLLLNDEGYKEAIKRIEELTQLPKYSKEEL